MKVGGGQLNRVSGAVWLLLHWGGGWVCERGIPPPAGGGGGNSRQIFKFCIPIDAFWCIFRAKKCLFGFAEPQIVSGSC